MIISTRPIRIRGAAARAFTLTEVIITSTLTGIVVAAILSTFLMMGRTGANIRNYTELEAQARKALEVFARDVRMAGNVSWNGGSPSDATNVTLALPNATLPASNTEITYFWDTDSTSATYRCFCRKAGAYDSTNVPTVLVRNVTVFHIYGFKIGGGTTTATNALDTKQVQLNLTASRTSTTVVTATDLVLSARFILRNKSVTI